MALAEEGYTQLLTCTAIETWVTVTRTPCGIETKRVTICFNTSLIIQSNKWTVKRKENVKLAYLIKFITLHIKDSRHTLFMSLFGKRWTNSQTLIGNMWQMREPGRNICRVNHFIKRSNEMKYLVDNFIPPIFFLEYLYITYRAHTVYRRKMADNHRQKRRQRWRSPADTRPDCNMDRWYMDWLERHDKYQ